MTTTALITGASSGMGYKFGQLLAREGHNLVLVARNQQKLEQLAEECREQYGVQAKVIAKDLSHPSAADEVLAELERESIDILVNNAGTQVYGPFSENDLAKELQMIQVNVSALTHLTKLFLPGMIERGHGRILNLGSTGSFAPGPLNAVYCATKAYVLSFSEAIAEELAGTGVTVTALCPGATRTEFAVKHGLEDSNLFTGPGVLDAETVVQTGYRALMGGKRVVVPGLWNRIQTFAIRFLPRKMVTGMAQRMMSTR